MPLITKKSETDYAEKKRTVLVSESAKHRATTRTSNVLDESTQLEGVVLGRMRVGTQRAALDGFWICWNQ